MELKQCIFNWSGGKDSALAYHHALNDPKIQINRLLTTVSQEHQRISMHGVRNSLLAEQVKALQVPASILELPPSTDMVTYDELMEKTLRPLVDAGNQFALYGIYF